MIKNFLRAGYPALWINTHEERRAMEAMRDDLPKGYRAYSWDVVSGLTDHSTGKVQTQGMTDPLKAINTIMSLPSPSVMFLKDFHKFLGDIQVLRTFKNLLETMKKSNRHFVCVGPVVNIPIELEKDIHQLDFKLPTEEELVARAQKLVSDNDLKIEVKPEVVRCAKGLTLLEAENALSRSIIETKDISKKILEDEKLQVVKKSGLLEIFEPVPADQLVMPGLMAYIAKRRRGFTDPALAKAKPKGIVLIGPPGTGKSLGAKVIANVLGVPLIRLDIGSLKGSKVGESEKRMRQALAMIDAIGFCVVWVDEIEKVLTGVQSSGKSDAGTTATMFGNLLTWMVESKEPHYFVATCNDIDDLLAISQGAFLRAGRIDDIFMVDLPNLDERMAILKIMNKRYGQNIDLAKCDDTQNWTGAEIEKFVIGSIYDGMEESFAMVKPVFNQNQAVIEQAREWAKHNARRANGDVPKDEGTGRRLSV